MRKGIIAALAASFTLALSTNIYAGEWVRPEPGTWKWQEDNGAYLIEGWHWLDGDKDGTYECYYFNSDGVLVIGSERADGYTIDENGAWCINGVTQTKHKSDMDGVSRYALTTNFVRSDLVDLLGQTADELVINLSAAEVNGGLKIVHDEIGGVNLSIGFDDSNEVVYLYTEDGYLAMCNTEDRTKSEYRDVESIDGLLGGGGVADTSTGVWAHKICEDPEIYFNIHLGSGDTALSNRAYLQLRK